MKENKLRMKVNWRQSPKSQPANNISLGFYSWKCISAVGTVQQLDGHEKHDEMSPADNATDHAKYLEIP